MRVFVLVLVVLIWQLGPQFAWAKPAEECRAVLEQNFAATTAEDLKGLMGTLDRQLPQRDEFEREAKQVFADTDLYLRVQEFELLAVKGPWAAARVVQLTLPADEDDREVGTDQQLFYRRHSMLLPEYDLVEYTQTFHKSGGKWRLWLVTTQPQQARGATKGVTMVESEAVRPASSVFGGDCANGRCRVP